MCLLELYELRRVDTGGAVWVSVFTPHMGKYALPVVSSNHEESIGGGVLLLVLRKTRLNVILL